MNQQFDTRLHRCALRYGFHGFADFFAMLPKQEMLRQANFLLDMGLSKERTKAPAIVVDCHLRMAAALERVAHE